MISSSTLHPYAEWHVEREAKINDFLTYSIKIAWGIPLLIFFNNSFPSRILTVSYWKFTWNTSCIFGIFTAYQSLSTFIFTYSVFVLPETVLHVHFKHAILPPNDVMSSVHLKYFSIKSSTDMFFTNMSCLMLYSLSVSSCDLSRLQPFNKIPYGKILSLTSST